MTKTHRPKTVFLWTALYHYALLEFGKLEPVTRLHKRINDPEATFFEQFQKIDEDDSIVSYQTILNFIYRRRPVFSKNVEAIIAAFLVEKRFVTHSDLVQFWDESILGSRSFPAGSSLSREQLSALEGLHIHEGSAWGETLIANYVWAASRNDTLTVRSVEKIYRRQSDQRYRGFEDGFTYQNRINDGLSNEDKMYLGSAWCSGQDVIIELAPCTALDRNSIRRRGIIQPVDIGSPREIKVTLNDDRVSRLYYNYTQNTGKSLGNPKKLTKRLINNTIKTERLFDEDISHQLINMGLVGFSEAASSLNDLDVKLLEGAAKGDAATMAEALLLGADINAQDRLTGMTVLHNACSSLSPIAVSLLTRIGGLQDDYDGLLSYLKSQSEEFDLTKVDFTLRAAAKQLNPLILDKEYRFASSVFGMTHDPFDLPANSTAHALKEWLYAIASELEEMALASAGHPKVLNRLAAEHVKAAIEATSTEREPNGP